MNIIMKLDKLRILERLFDLIEKITDRMNKFEQGNKNENKINNGNTIER